MPKDWVHRPWGKPEKGRKIRTLRKNYLWNSSRPYVACGTTNNDWPGFKRVTSQWASTFYILQFCGVSTKSPPDKDIGVPRDNPHCAAGKDWNLMIAHNWIGQLDCTAHHQHQPGIFYIHYPWYISSSVMGPHPPELQYIQRHKPRSPRRGRGTPPRWPPG